MLRSAQHDQTLELFPSSCTSTLSPPCHRSSSAAAAPLLPQNAPRRLAPRALSPPDHFCAFRFALSASKRLAPRHVPVGAAAACYVTATDRRLPLLRPSIRTRLRALSPPDRFALCALRFEAPRRIIASSCNSIACQGDMRCVNYFIVSFVFPALYSIQTEINRLCDCCWLVHPIA